MRKPFVLASLVLLASVSFAQGLKPVRGVGLNVHAQKLPIARLKAIGIEWVRIDLQRKDWNRDRAQQLFKHYKNDFGILWIVYQDFPDPAAHALELMRMGVRDIEIFNEPKMAGIHPRDYARKFKDVQQAVKGRARLYGPSLSTWTNERYYLNEAKAHGMKDFIPAVHFYWEGTPEETARKWRAQAPDAVCTEITFPDDYRRQLGIKSIGEAFLRSKKAFQGLTWCWYRGPNPDKVDTGLFDWDGAEFTRPNATYWEIHRALNGR